jgi:glycerol-3-phosphate acyltransferase PlsY
MTPFLLLLSAVLAYLLGAIPFGWLVARSRGVDIRSVGSRNIGATNVFRSVGKGWGILTFALDFLKGWVACAWIVPLVLSLAGRFAAVPALSGSALAAAKLLCGVMAVVGHSFPVYLGFKGGKGVATGAGLLLGIAPAACGIAFAVWLAVFLAGRYVSLASISAALALAVVAWLLPAYRAVGWWLPASLAVLALLVVLRHHANIGRLLRGTEYRFEFGRKPKDA